MATNEPSLFRELLSTLKSLRDSDFKDFKLLLTDKTLMKEYEVMRRNKVEDKEPRETLQAMLDTYGIFTIDVMKRVLREMKCKTTLENLCELPYDLKAVLTSCQNKLKSSLVKSEENIPFTEAEPEIFITKRGSVHGSAQDSRLLCGDIFKEQEGKRIRTVVTKRVGKTSPSVRFSLDWAEDRANQDIDLLFTFTFKDLKKFRRSELSLVELLHRCFSQTEDLFSFQCLKLLFIFDGLDECGLLLDFSRTRALTDPTQRASVEELLVNLIRGDLMPSANIWITTRSDTANQIPEEYVSMVTEVRGLPRLGSMAIGGNDELIDIEMTEAANAFPTEKTFIGSDFQRLYGALKDLQDPEMELFVFFLKDYYPNIPNSSIKGQSRPRVVEIILLYDRDNAINTICKILREMDKNDLADRLQKDQESRARAKSDQRTIPGNTSPNPSTSDLKQPQPRATNWTKETVFDPEVSRPSGELLYRFRCTSSGTFHCSSTGLVFVVTKEAELQYRIVQWDESLLQSSGRIPAGPLYDIKCPEKAVCELHLPHCEPETADLSQSQLSVVHIDDSGLSLIEPQRITESHVVIPVSGLSCLFISWPFKRGSSRPVRGQVLLFRTPRESGLNIITINMHLLPRNIPRDQVENKQRLTTEFIPVPARCKLVIDQLYSVKCPGAQIQPNRAPFEMDNDPNYHPLFELRLPPDSSSASITLRKDGSSEDRGVWTHEVHLTSQQLKELRLRERSDGVALVQDRANEDQPHSSTADMASTSTVAEGAFGKVYKKKYNGEWAAMKKVPLEDLQLKDLRRECKIYREAKHPNIVEILGPIMIDDDDKCTIPLEWISGEELETTIFKRQESKIQLTDAVRHTIIMGMCEGLKYLHSKDIVHQDLKPDNIMVEHETHRAVIIDLGLAKFYKDGVNSALNRGNPAYSAPEVRQWHRQRSQSSDVWAMGKIITELILMERLETDTVRPATIDLKLKDSSYCRVVCAMVEPDPAKRATMDKVIEDLGLMDESGRITGTLDQQSSTSEDSDMK